MTDKLDIVLFPKGFERGIPASNIELVDQNSETVTYTVTFEKPGGPPVAAVKTPDLPEPGGDARMPIIGGDDGPTPEGIDYEEMPELPAAVGVAA